MVSIVCQALCKHSLISFKTAPKGRYRESSVKKWRGGSGKPRLLESLAQGKDTPLVRVSRCEFQSKSVWLWHLFPSTTPWLSMSWTSTPVLEWPVKKIRPDHSHWKGQVQVRVQMVFKHLNPKKRKCVAWMKLSTLRMMVIKPNGRQEWEKVKKKKVCSSHVDHSTPKRRDWI